MAASHRHDEQAPAPAVVDAGPQSDASGTGGEPKGAHLQPPQRDRSAAQSDLSGTDEPARARASDKLQPGYRARPAGQSGLGAQDDLASPFDEPQGEGNYLATDSGDKPLRNG